MLLHLWDGCFLRFVTFSGMCTLLRLAALLQVHRWIALAQHNSLSNRTSPRLPQLHSKITKPYKSDQRKYFWSILTSKWTGVKLFCGSITRGQNMPPWSHRNFKWGQRHVFYGYGLRKQDVSHFVSRWITTVQWAASYLQARPGWATQWLTRLLSKQAFPGGCELELAPFRITIDPWSAWKFTENSSHTPFWTRYNLIETHPPALTPC